MLSSTVLAGTVITAVTRGGSVHVTVSLINLYKEGGLAIQQAGKNMSAKVIVVCKHCPLLRRGRRAGAPGTGTGQGGLSGASEPGAGLGPASGG